MGVLEEAIREHLELKRRHGATDAEVEQEEAEALGPARRGFEEPADEAAEEAADEAAPAHDQSTQIHEQLPAEPALDEPEPESEPEPELEFEPEPEPQGDTLLPEAPDFIEETPEHDRVRSDRKPPQDLDFE
jgi:hypothetical protein